MDKKTIKAISENYADTIINDKTNPMWQSIYVAHKNGLELGVLMCEGKDTTDELPAGDCNKPHVNARSLPELRQRAEKVVNLIELMNETFTGNPREHMITVIMACIHDSLNAR